MYLWCINQLTELVLFRHMPMRFFFWGGGVICVPLSYKDDLNVKMLLGTPALVNIAVTFVF